MKALILDGNPSEIDEDYNRYLSEIAEHLIKKGHTVKTLTLER